MGARDTSPAPDALITEIQDAAGDPPLVPLSLGAPPSSLRPGAAGRLVTRTRRGLIRVIAPSLLELVGQLEHDRHATHKRIAELEARIAALEGRREAPGE